MRPVAGPLGWVMAAALCVNACDRRPAVPSGVDAHLERMTGARLVGGNELVPIENGAVFDAVVQAIEEARSHVHIVTYIWRGETGPSLRVTRALVRRAPGVECRILVDPFGSFKFDGDQKEALRRSGCEVRSYGLRADTRATARNHRKIVIVDGTTGITGGFGYHTSFEGNGRKRDEWRDSAVRVRGPAVAQMQRAFEQNWREAGGADLPRAAHAEAPRRGDTRAAFVASSPRGDEPSPAEAMTHLLVVSARERLWIANSYFVPDRKLQELIAERARAGVEVRVLAPGPVHDVAPVRAGQRATYEKLLEAGVRIFEYQPSMMHAKTIVVDDRWVAIGSTNMDELSFERLEEGSVVADSPKVARHLLRQLAADFEHSQEITRELWEDRNPVVDVAREAASFFSEWM